MGAIFPISSGHVSRIFDDKRTAFVKYTKFSRLGKNSRLVFKVSKERKLIGEGTIERIEKMNPETAWARYGHQIFLNEIEFGRYVSKSPVTGKSRGASEISVFILKNLKKYKKAVQWTQNITPAGRYLTKEEYQRITTE